MATKREPTAWVLLLSFPEGYKYGNLALWVGGSLESE
jgi:hypothetical protein